MKALYKFRILPFFVLFVTILGCDLSQFDPTKPRARYETEREASNRKPAALTKTGELPQDTAKGQSETPSVAPNSAP